MKKAAEFLDKITKNDGVVIIYNNDGDGICACAMIMKFLENRGMKRPYIISQPMPMDKNIVQRVKMSLPHKIIFLDMAADQQQGILKQLGGLCEMLIIDHHQVFKNMNTPRIVHYNPRIEKRDRYQSTSYCVYKILSEILDVSESLWVAGVGMVSDYNLEDSKDVEKDIKHKYKIEGKLYDTQLGRIADMISATAATKALSYDQMVEVIKTATYENFNEIHNADKMIESFNTIKHEMEELLQDAESNMERAGKVFIYHIKSKYNLSSPLSTRLSEKYEKNLVIIYQINGNKLKVSGRNQAKNINAGKVLQKAAMEAGGSGGGHEAAAGATIHPEKWNVFRETMLKIVNK